MARTAAGSGLRIEYGLIAAGIAVAIIAAGNGFLSALPPKRRLGKRFKFDAEFARGHTRIRVGRSFRPPRGGSSRSQGPLRFARSRDAVDCCHRPRFVTPKRYPGMLSMYHDKVSRLSYADTSLRVTVRSRHSTCLDDAITAANKASAVTDATDPTLFGRKLCAVFSAVLAAA